MYIHAAAALETGYYKTKPWKVVNMSMRQMNKLSVKSYTVPPDEPH